MITTKERRLICTGDEVRGFLDGSRRQIRRVVKPQPIGWHRPMVGADGAAHGYCGSGPEEGRNSPLGTVGDRLWVRETWNTTPIAHLAPGEKIGKPVADCVRDNGGFAVAAFDGGVVYAADGVSSHPEFGKARWRPSIHMPRWASRIDLEITGVRVERLQDISEEDAKNEGVQMAKHPLAGWTNYARKGAPNPPMKTARESFSTLWQSIYGNWDANPWVWVYEFRRIRP